MSEEKKVVYLPFYQGIFSQWHHSKFQDPELPAQYRAHVFTSGEQYMMFRKALLFKDPEYIQAILEEHNCRKVKSLGRRIRGFSDELWVENREDIVTRGNYLKFSQDPELKAKLLETQGKHLVEASPRDSIWGIGLSIKSKYVQNPMMWRGLNLLGKGLDRAREMILANKKRKSLVDPSYDSDFNSDSDSDFNFGSDSDFNFDFDFDPNSEDIEKILSWNRFKSRVMSDIP